MTTDLREIEERAAEQLEAAEALARRAEAEEAALEEWEREPPLPPLRTGLVVACSTMAAAVMIGGIFEGLAGKVAPAVAGACGIAVAAQASRRRSALVANLTIVLGVFLTGLVLVLPAGIEEVTRMVPLLRDAKGASAVLRPPAEFLPGYRMMVGWLMASVGFAAGWVGIELRRPGIGLLVPLPIIAMGAISVPDSAKLAAGLVSVVLFIAGLAGYSSLQNLARGEGEAPGLGYEMRRAARAVPLVAVLTGIVAAAARMNLLFPPPIYDPVKEAQRPKPVPLSQAVDRVLFEVRSQSTGPWRLGLLDVDDGAEWRLPACAESNLRPVPRSGVVNDELDPGLRADFLVKGLGGAILPGVPNTVGIIARGPKLAYDTRTGNIRLAEGQIRDGLQYTVTAAALPAEEELRRVRIDLPSEMRRFLELPTAPPAVQKLLEEAPPEPAWDRLQFVRRRFLETVVAAGEGIPAPVPPSRVQDMLAGSKEGSPFEIVAAQVMLARWAGIPARIGYGYDGGDVVGKEVRAVRPKHGASWLEVAFPGHGWLPIIGNPLKAKVNLSSESQTNPLLAQPAKDVGVEVWIPLRIEEKGLFYKQMQRIIALLAVLALIVLAVYVTFPAAWKAYRRVSRRRWARRAGSAARIEVAYAEFRDLCTDLGVGGVHRTPLGLLSEFADDEEHTELAWLVTRGLWGDMREALTDDDAQAAEELARVLGKRLRQAMPLTLRAVAAVSRLSIRRPYAPEVRPPTRKELQDASRVAA